MATGDATMIKLLKQIEINTGGAHGVGGGVVGSGGGGSPLDACTGACGGGGDDDGGGGGGGAMDKCTGMCGGGDDDKAVAGGKTAAGAAASGGRSVGTAGGAGTAGCIECPGLTGKKSPNRMDNAPGMCPCGPGDMADPMGIPDSIQEWRVRRYRNCVRTEPGGCWEGICGNENDPRYKQYGYYDSYIGGDQKDCTADGDKRGPWYAPNIWCFNKIPVGPFCAPCKIHVRRCFCCCECCCCDCGECYTSTIGCQCPCTCIPEDMRCCHCTCGLFPEVCHPVVNTLCCGDWEVIQEADENVPNHLEKPNLDLCCRCACAGAGSSDQRDSK